MFAEVGEGDGLTTIGAFYGWEGLVRGLGHRKERGARQGGIELVRNVG